MRRPLVASLAAGVLQAYPLLSAEEIYNAIINSADQAFRPDNLKGYGLPNFLAIKNYLESFNLQKFWFRGGFCFRGGGRGRQGFELVIHVNDQLAHDRGQGHFARLVPVLEARVEGGQD